MQMHIDELLSELTDSLKPQGELRPLCIEAAETITRLRNVVEAAGGLVEEIIASGTHTRWKRTASAIRELNHSARQPE
jgi:hypothetical protein